MLCAPFSAVAQVTDAGKTAAGDNPSSPVNGGFLSPLLLTTRNAIVHSGSR